MPTAEHWIAIPQIPRATTSLKVFHQGRTNYGRIIHQELDEESQTAVELIVTYLLGPLWSC